MRLEGGTADVTGIDCELHSARTRLGTALTFADILEEKRRHVKVQRASWDESAFSGVKFSI
jgi:hypothetical protein